MTLYRLICQLKRPYRWARSFLRYHFGPGKKVEIGFSGDVPDDLKGRTFKGRVHNRVFTSRLNLRTSPRAGTIVHVTCRKK